MARKDDYIPANDELMKKWLAGFEAYVMDHLDELKLTAGEVAFLPAERTEFEEALEDYRSLKALLRAATKRKATARTAVEKHTRPLAQQISKLQTVTNDMRSMMGLNPVSTVRVRRGVSNVPPGLVLTAAKGMVTVHFGTVASNELLNGKPEWALGCNIYRKIEGQDHFEMVALATKSPYYDVIEHTSPRVTYYVAYRSRNSSREGPPSSERTVAVLGMHEDEEAA